MSAPATPIPDEAELARLAGRVRAFLQICQDFGTMSGGEFRAKYPDHDYYEGYGYIMRHAARLRSYLLSSEVERG